MGKPDTSMCQVMTIQTSLDEVAEAISKVLKGKNLGLNFDKEKLNEYLIEVNGFMELGRLPVDELEDNFKAAAALYLFKDQGDLGWRPQEETEKIFRRIIKKKHGLDLILFFEPVDREDYEFNEEYKKMTSENIIVPDFAGTENSIRKLKNKLGMLSSILHSEKHYTTNGHYTFVRWKDVLLPLLGGYDEREHFKADHQRLRDAHGDFYFYSPVF